MAKKPTYSELLKIIDQLEKKCAKHDVARKRYRNAENIYRLFFENSSVATAVIENNGIISYVNAQFENLYGAKKSEIQGKIKWQKLVYKNYLDIIKDYDSLRRSGDTSVPTSYEFRILDNSNRPGTLTVGFNFFSLIF